MSVGESLRGTGGQTIRRVITGSAVIAVLLGIFTNPAAAASDPVVLQSSIDRLESLGLFIARLIAYVAFIAGAITLGYGGIEYMFSNSSVDRESRGRTRVVQSLVGLGISAGAITFVSVLENGLGISQPSGVGSGDGGSGGGGNGGDDGSVGTNPPDEPSQETTESFDLGETLVESVEVADVEQVAATVDVGIQAVTLLG